MKIKGWQYALFIGSIGALVIYINRKSLSKYTSIKAWQDLLVNFANKWENVAEYGYNASFSNEVFQKMLEKVGWRSGESWCMYFAKAVHVETFPKDVDKINKVLNGLTQGSFNNAKNDKSGTYKVITSGEPQKGDIAIWVHLDDASKGHAAIVTSLNSNNTFNTIEGNTNQAGSREGDKVLKKVRALTYGKPMPNSTLALRGFIRKINA
jgi:hypothetical protein